MASQAGRIPCPECRLQSCTGLRPLEPAQLSYMDEFKRGDRLLARGDLLLVQGQASNFLHTLYDGVLLRYRTLEDGRRQIVNFMFPGDLVGLQGAFAEPSSHTIEALVTSRVCDFARSDFHALLTNHPSLGYDLTWLAAKEERALEEHIVSLGQRNARERVAYLAVWLLDRAQATGMAQDDNRLVLPITQAQIADMLGLSLVHANRTLRSLERDGIVVWKAREITVPDMQMTCEFAQYERSGLRVRPFI